MTPNKLLEMVVDGFAILLFDDSEKLNSQMVKALTFYQVNVGVEKKVAIEIDTLTGLTSALPEAFLKRINICDDRGSSYSSDQVSQSQLKVVLDDHFLPPAELTYFEDMAGSDFDTYELPPESIAPLTDYLDVLIRIPNNELKAAIAAQIEVVDPTVADHSTLIARKLEAEEAIRALSPALGVVSFL